MCPPQTAGGNPLPAQTAGGRFAPTPDGRWQYRCHLPSRAVRLGSPAATCRPGRSGRAPQLPPAVQGGQPALPLCHLPSGAVSQLSPAATSRLGWERGSSPRPAPAHPVPCVSPPHPSTAPRRAMLDFKTEQSPAAALARPPPAPRHWRRTCKGTRRSSGRTTPTPPGT